MSVIIRGNLRAWMDAKSVVTVRAFGGRRKKLHRLLKNLAAIWRRDGASSKVG